MTEMLSLVQEKRFLGQEFLTWLWHVSEEQGYAVLADGRQVEVLLGDHLALGPAQGQEGTRVTVRGHEASLSEARQALRRGKLLDSLRLGLRLDGEEYWLGLDAPTLGVKSLRLPTTAPSEDRAGLAGLLLERIALIETAVSAVQGLLGRYLELRLASGGQLPEAMRAWAVGES